MTEISKSEARRVCEEWFRRVWAEEDAGAISELMPQDAKAHGLGDQSPLDPTAFEAFHAVLLRDLTDVRVTIDHMIEDETWAAMLTTVTARRRSDGSPVTATGQAFLRIEDGKIQEAYNHFDLATLFEHAGLMPAGTMAKAFSGEGPG